ncbi:MAG: SOS response-associated peptidase, partial [Desulfobulbia bacterium]
IIESARWGLVPSWWKKSLRELPSTINSRGETVHEKPMFRSAFRSRRCLIPVSGFFEWKRTGDAKQPYYITLVDNHPMTFAGIWEEWTNPESGEIIVSASILTISANSVIQIIHHRMPVILGPEEFSEWLTEGGHELIKPCPDNWLDFWPVSRDVNSPKNNHSGLMTPIT